MTKAGIPGHRQDSGSAGTEKILNELENDTKTKFQENIPGKSQFQKNGRGNRVMPPHSGLPSSGGWGRGLKSLGKFFSVPKGFETSLEKLGLKK